MTIHRAEGLEFDVVVLPALDRPLLRPPPAPVHLLRRSPLAPIDAVHRSVAAGVRRLAPELEDGHQQELARRLRDDLSVLYVALTRARQALYSVARAASRRRRRPREERREILSFAEILRRSTLGVECVAPVDVAESRSRTLYVAGDAAAAASSIAAARSAIGGERQRRLPLTPRERATPRRALRACRGARRPPSRGSDARGRDPERRDRDRGFRRGLARDRGCPGGSRRRRNRAHLAVSRAREWLLAGNRSLERVERRRRFAAPVGGRIVAGELARSLDLHRGARSAEGVDRQSRPWTRGDGATRCRRQPRPTADRGRGSALRARAGSGGAESEQGLKRCAKTPYIEASGDSHATTKSSSTSTSSAGWD